MHPLHFTRQVAVMGAMGDTGSHQRRPIKGIRPNRCADHGRPRRQGVHGSLIHAIDDDKLYCGSASSDQICAHGFELGLVTTSQCPSQLTPNAVGFIKVLSHQLAGKTRRPK